MRFEFSTHKSLEHNFVLMAQLTISLRKTNGDFVELQQKQSACWHQSFKAKFNVMLKLVLPLQAWKSLEVCRSLKRSEFLDNQYIKMIKWRTKYKNDFFLFLFPRQQWN
jgi:hypothetical protein